MNLVFKKITYGNLDIALKVAQEIFYYEKEKGPDFWFPFFVTKTSKELKNNLQKNKNSFVDYFLVVNSQGKPIGLTGLYQMSYEKDKKIGWLAWFGILPKFRGQGLSKLILRWTEKYALKKNITTIKLFTSNSKEEKIAQGLYEKYGYRIYRKTQDNKIFWRRKKIKKT